jgi:hypothetical protein
MAPFFKKFRILRLSLCISVQMRIALPAVILCRTLAAQIQSGENWVKSSENWEKLGISKKMICHQVWLSHLTRAIIGGALSQPVLHWASQETPSSKDWISLQYITVTPLSKDCIIVTVI